MPLLDVSKDMRARFRKPYTAAAVYVLIRKPLVFDSTIKSVGVPSQPQPRDGVNSGVSPLGSLWFKNMWLSSEGLARLKAGLVDGTIELHTHDEMVALGHLIHERAAEPDGKDVLSESPRTER